MMARNEWWRLVHCVARFLGGVWLVSATAVWAAAIEECIAQPLGYWALEEASPGSYADTISPGTAGECFTGGCPTLASTDLLVGNAQFFAASNNTGINILDLFQHSPKIFIFLCFWKFFECP